MAREAIGAIGRLPIQRLVTLNDIAEKFVVVVVEEVEDVHMHPIVRVLLNERLVVALDVVRRLYLEAILSHDLHQVVGTLTEEHSRVDVVVVGNEAVVAVKAQFRAEDRQQLSADLAAHLVHLDESLHAILVELFKLLAVDEISVHIDKHLVDAKFLSYLNN